MDTGPALYLTDILKYRLDRQLNLKCSTIDWNAYFCLIIIIFLIVFNLRYY